MAFHCKYAGQMRVSLFELTTNRKVKDELRLPFDDGTFRVKAWYFGRRIAGISAMKLNSRLLTEHISVRC